jgi:hypothetical protein
VDERVEWSAERRGMNEENGGPIRNDGELVDEHGEEGNLSV